MSKNDTDDIIQVTKTLGAFWSHSHGWASTDAADLLAEARLDRQLSFAHTLKGYLVPFQPEETEARQILGYTTLRSLCEGTLKLFFSVYYEDYRNGQDVVYDRKRNLVSPEDIAFDRLISLYAKKGDARFEPFLRRVQQRGNAIHYFSDRAIGTQTELVGDIQEFRNFLFTVNSQLPYP